MAPINISTEKAASDPCASPVERPATRLRFIDGLRAMAMLTVLLSHCWLYGNQWTVTLPLGGHPINLASVLVYGNTGVNLFLVLSGFCLYWPFVKNGKRREPTLWEFTKKRCRRILPPYYVTLVLFGTPLFVLAVRHHSCPEIVFAWNWLWLHALMAHNLNPTYVIRVNGALWTLALEFQLYILFPLLVEAFRRFNARGVLLTVLVASTCYRILMWKAQTAPAGYIPEFGSGFVLSLSVFGRCFEFVLGMYCALLVARWPAERKSPLSWPDYLLFALVVPMEWLDQGRNVFYDAMWGLLYAALLLMASAPRSLANRALSSRALVSLGIFSYSVYLIHQPLVISLSHFATRHFSSVGVKWFELCMVAPLMVGLGYLFHLLFERPFMNAPRDVNAPRDRKPAPQAAYFRLRRPPPAPPAAGEAGTPEDAGPASDLLPGVIPPIIQGERGYDKL